MARTYHVRSLEEGEFARAYPLIRVLDPELSLNAWLGFARLFTVSSDAAARGIIAAQDDRGYIYGLCCYTALPHLCHKISLIVEPFVALHVVDPLGPSVALLEALEPIARRLDCAAIELVLPRSGSAETLADAAAAGAFRAAGYELEGIRLCRRLPQARPH